MKNVFLFGLSIVLISCSSSRFPNTVPADFKIEYNHGGGKINMNRHIIIQKGECMDEGREAEGKDYKYVWQLTDSFELQNLYTSLKDLKVFTIPSKNEGQVMDRGGEKMSFTVNGKTYLVDNSGSNFISKKDGPAFDEAVKKITSYAGKNRTDNLLEEKVTIVINTDTAKVENADNTTEFPKEMPADFRIRYNMGAGFTGFYRVINIHAGECTEEGKDQNGRYNRTFNVNQSDLKKLYSALYMKNAFIIRYQEKGMVYDRGGVELTFTLNSKDYVVSNKDNMFVIEKDLERFNSVAQLIEDFADKFKKN